ncbi:MAG TPA: FtsW/RodA/SpoVE family cell cycle protein [Candidatus Dormibacteraeota bacterium]|nr:FtsW/RodA/SpoVE family cell cycle protein [Candidatus Dormibacteraeota bacterium]
MNPNFGIGRKNIDQPDSLKGLRRHRPDYVLLILCAALLAIGLITIFAISPGLTRSTNVPNNYYVEKQSIAILIGLIGFSFSAIVSIDIWKKYLTPLIIVSIVVSLAVRVVGVRVNGAFRWIQFGGISFQPVELVKFTILIWIAGFFAKIIREGGISNLGKNIKPLIYAFFIIGVIVAGLQSDLGSTVVIVIMMSTVAVVAGVPIKKLIYITVAVLLIGIIAISSSSYRKNRLLTFLHPTQNCQSTSTGWQACQAIIAVGSGGIAGKGLARGVQVNGYLPESDNDTIFAAYAEQFGFIGTVILVCIFFALFKRIKDIMERAPNNYTRFIATGVLTWLSIQTLINIGAMVGLLPLKGITLPLMSYGGTSIVFVMLAIGVVFNISYYTTSNSIYNEDVITGANNENSSMRRRYGRTHNAYPRHRS